MSILNVEVLDECASKAQAGLRSLGCGSSVLLGEPSSVPKGISLESAMTRKTGTRECASWRARASNSSLALLWFRTRTRVTSMVRALRGQGSSLLTQEGLLDFQS